MYLASLVCLCAFTLINGAAVVGVIGTTDTMTTDIMTTDTMTTDTMTTDSMTVPGM
jgi:pentapeptide MXKDX repeat protein